MKEYIIYIVIGYVAVAVTVFAMIMAKMVKKNAVIKRNSSAERIIKESILSYSILNPYKAGRSAPPSAKRVMAEIKVGKKAAVYDPSAGITFGSAENNRIRIFDKSVSRNQGIIKIGSNKVVLTNISKKIPIVLKTGLFSSTKVMPGRSAALNRKNTININGNKIKAELFIFDCNNR